MGRGGHGCAAAYRAACGRGYGRLRPEFRGWRRILAQIRRGQDDYPGIRTDVKRSNSGDVSMAATGTTVIKGGTVVTADLSYKADVLIEGGVITQIGANLSGDKTLDA